MSNKKGNYKPPLTEAESKKVLDLYISGKTQEVIASTIGRSRSTIRMAITRAFEKGQIPPYLKIPVVHDRKELEEKDLSSLPDNVLFEHSKEYIL